MEEDLAALGRRIVGGADDLTLATVDADGVPWPTPVWFAHERFATFLWVSRPGARHSANIAARPEVGIVVFDSTATPGEGRGAYIEAQARRVGDDDLDRWIDVYSARSQARIGPAWTVADVTRPDGLRLYAADVTATWVLDDRDRRVPYATLEG